jgi:hypothetical protein
MPGSREVLWKGYGKKTRFEFRKYSKYFQKLHFLLQATAQGLSHEIYLSFDEILKFFS